MSDLFGKLTANDFFTYTVNSPIDDTRQLDDQKLMCYGWFLATNKNPVDNTLPLDKQSLTIHTFVDLQVNKPESTFAWDVDTEGATNVQGINVYPYFLTIVDNPKPDSKRQLNEQQLKVIDFAEITINRAAATWTTNPDNATDSKQPLTFYDWALTNYTNPAPDPQKDLGEQLLKVYDWALWEVDNPPWVRGNLTIPNYIKVIWEQHPVRFALEIGHRLEAWYYLKLDGNLEITPTLSAENWQFAYPEESLNITPTIGVTWEQHQVRDGLTISDSFMATQTTHHKARLRMRHSFAAENIQYASIFQKVTGRGRISVDTTWETLEPEQITITPTLRVASETARVREKAYITTFYGQFETNPWRSMAYVFTTFSAEATNPEYLYVTDRGRWRTWFEYTYIEPPVRISETLKLSHEFTYTATNPTTIDPDPVDPTPTPTPTPDTGVSAAEEIMQDFVYMTDKFSVTETVSYRDVLAVATWAEHSPHSRAVMHEWLMLKYEVLETSGGHDELWAKILIKDFLKISSKDIKSVLESARISTYFRAEGGVSEEEHTTYVINEDNETTRYEHWPFEGYAAFKGIHLGCGPDGIYVLTGDDDNGEPISAMINFGKQSFGSSQMKRVPYVYASLASDGDMHMQVSYTDDNVYMYPARKVDEYNATVRFDLGRGIKANYLNFELYNENGSKFDLRNVWIYLTELSRRI